ncbi:MAG TPA: hypothetical protein PKK43_16870, partial [Spirochaetota bacterium]|nr:hypothetical protein [Spirochaetota bacterium]
MIRRSKSPDVPLNKRSEFLRRTERVLAGSVFSLLILHEMDAVCWKEWRLFGIGDDSIGRMIFISVHLPMVMFLFAAYSSFQKRWAYLFSRGLAVFILIHFLLHVWAYNEGYFTDVFSF